MASCCGRNTCLCLVEGDEGILVDGTGAGDNPYLISIDPEAVASQEVEDMVLTGRLNDAVLTGRFQDIPQYVSAADMRETAIGTPNYDDIGAGVPSWRLGDVVAAPLGEAISLGRRIPRSWATFQVVVYGCNATADAGNVFIRVLHMEKGTLSDLNDSSDSSASASVVTAGAQWIRQGVSMFTTGLENNGDIHYFRILRVSDDPSDTKVGDYAITGIDFVPLTYTIFEAELPEEPEDLEGRTFTQEMNAFIPAGVKVIQQAAPPDSDNDSAGTFQYFPANVFTSFADFSASSWSLGERWVSTWGQRQNYDPAQVNNKPNFLWGAGFKTGGFEVRPTYTTIDRAAAATQVQVRHICGFSAGDVLAPWTAVGGVVGDLISEADAKADMANTFPNTFEATSGYGSGNIYRVSVDKVILPTNVLGADPTVLVDYEVADGRTEAETTALFTALAADAHSVGKKIALYTNPLTNLIMFQHGIGANLPTLLSLVDYISLQLNSLNGEATIEEAYAAGIAALGVDTTPEWAKVMLVLGMGSGENATTLADAQFVHSKLVEPGVDHPQVLNIWRFLATPGGLPTRDYNKRLSMAVFGTTTPPGS